MNGLPGWLQWMGWLINSMMILILSDTLVIILLFLGTVKFGDPGVWYFILLLYIMAATSFCFFLSTFFIRRKQAFHKNICRLLDLSTTIILNLLFLIRSHTGHYRWNNFLARLVFPHIHNFRALSRKYNIIPATLRQSTSQCSLLPSRQNHDDL